MGRIIGIVLFVVALWFMASQYSGGFGSGGDADAQERVQPVTERVRDSVLQAQDENEARRRKLLGE
jgi:hypothetical protein